MGSTTKKALQDDLDAAQKDFDRICDELTEGEERVKRARARKRAADARRIDVVSRAMMGAVLHILGPDMARRGFDLRGLGELVQDIENAELDLKEVRRRIFADQASNVSAFAGAEIADAVVEPSSAEPEVDSDNEGN